VSPAPNLAAVHVTAEELLRRVAGEVVRAGVKLVAEPRFQPFDWNANHHEVEYLEKPYIPAGARIWLWGPAESAKSIFAQALAARLTREGRIVAYFDQENPEVDVQVKGDRFKATARTATDEEKPRLWEIMVEEWPAYNDYQDKTDREIPVVILERS
jgi:hypothetical protein